MANGARAMATVSAYIPIAVTTSLAGIALKKLSSINKPRKRSRKRRYI